MDEILSSKLFAPLYAARPGLPRLLQEKLVPVEGDLVLEGLGIDPAVRVVLQNEVHVILACAASVSFADPIREALNINYFGAKRVLELAHECKNLVALHHVSTAYVGSHHPRGTEIPECVETIPGVEDFEAFVDKLIKMEPQALEREEPQILKLFNAQNTYLVTKQLAEQALRKHRGNIRLSISRPAMVSCCDAFPFPGWIDSLAAGAVAVYSVGAGISRR